LCPLLPALNTKGLVFDGVDVAPPVGRLGKVGSFGGVVTDIVGPPAAVGGLTGWGTRQFLRFTRQSFSGRFGVLVSVGLLSVGLFNVIDGPVGRQRPSTSRALDPQFGVFPATGMQPAAVAIMFAPHCT
jgi:hypothetical protein